MTTTRPMHEIRNDLEAADEAYTLNYTEEQGDFVEGYNKNRAALVAELEDWFANH